MKLEVDDELIENATAEDVRRAFASRERNVAISIGLTRDGGNAIDADWVEGGYQVTTTENGKFHDADRPLDDYEAVDLFLKYLARDERWRDAATWTAWPDTDASAPAPVKSGGVDSIPAFFKGMPPWALAVLTLPLMFLIPMAFEMAVGFFDRIKLPSWADSTPARIVLGFFSAVVMLFLVATIVKVREVRKAAQWSKTSGRIVRSREGFDLVQRDREKMPVNERIADIVYEYQVAGRTYRAKRITFAEITGPDEVPGLLAGYPEGKLVDVYYDPAQPGEAVLDRTMDGLARGCLVLLAYGIAGIVLLMIAVTKGPGIIQHGLPNAIVPLMTIFGIGAFIVGVVGWNILKSGLDARRWPKTAARVTMAGVHEFTTISRDTGSSSSYRRTRSRQGFMPVVEYEYSVAGKSYTSRHVKLDTEVGGSKSYAEGIAAKYSVGKIVTIHYDPKDPQRAYIELSLTFGWFILALAAVLLLATLWSAGLFTDGPPLKTGPRR